MGDPFKGDKAAALLAQAIVDTVHEPLLVLDGDLRVVAASRSFTSIFRVASAEVLGRRIYDLVDGQFNLPKLQSLLENILPEHTTMEGFELQADFEGIGHRTLILNARQVFYEDSRDKTLLLAFEDITERRAVEAEKDELLRRTEDLLRQKEVLLAEMQHRIANSLQIIASILLLKARTVTSEETRLHLQDAHRRVVSIAEVQQHIRAAGHGEAIKLGPYLTKLCESLSASMIGEGNGILLQVRADEGSVVSADAVSIGLIVTELVINALKYAFPLPRVDGLVLVSYETSGDAWQLKVTDNGVGQKQSTTPTAKGGLGTVLVRALAHQLDAQVETVSHQNGMSVSITRATFKSRLQPAA
jgi:two-component sensor histidine kinase